MSHQELPQFTPSNACQDLGSKGIGAPRVCWGTPLSRGYTTGRPSTCPGWGGSCHPAICTWRPRRVCPAPRAPRPTSCSPESGALDAPGSVGLRAARRRPSPSRPSLHEKARLVDLKKPPQTNSQAVHISKPRTSQHLSIPAPCLSWEEPLCEIMLLSFHFSASLFREVELLCEVSHAGLCPCLGPCPCSTGPPVLHPGLGQEGQWFQLAPGF